MPLKRRRPRLIKKRGTRISQAGLPSVPTHTHSGTHITVSSEKSKTLLRIITNLIAEHSKHNEFTKHVCKRLLGLPRWASSSLAFTGHRRNCLSELRRHAADSVWGCGEHPGLHHHHRQTELVLRRWMSVEAVAGSAVRVHF